MNAEDAIVKYFIYKKICSKTEQKYGYYKRIIGYVLDTVDVGYIRKTFLNLVKNKYFIKIKNKNKKSYTYRFYEYERGEDSSDVATTSKNIYIISWD